MKGFPFHFREHAVPRLAEDCALQGVLIDAGSITFEEGAANVAATADKLGAWALPPKLFAEIGDWMLTTLSAEVQHATEEGKRLRLEQHRQRIAEPVAYYDSLAATCADPAIKWVFAAICPAYRAALLARKSVGQ